ncbi:hypothetical protein DU504_03210 [Haloplanus salinus]|uniref:Uncharacterized protein n=1 Tax=Haloplanus salinus TaxID=1126245 RepID=A0A368NA51_9EURY|nr:hypothetical protein DU504_03210 [Haloplanus salinus]
MTNTAPSANSPNRSTATPERRPTDGWKGPVTRFLPSPDDLQDSGRRASPECDADSSTAHTLVEYERDNGTTDIWVARPGRDDVASPECIRGDGATAESSGRPRYSAGRPTNGDL